MEGPLRLCDEHDKVNSYDEIKDLAGYDSNDTSPGKNYSDNLKHNKSSNGDSSGDEVSFRKCKKKTQRFTDSGSDMEVEIAADNGRSRNKSVRQVIDSEDEDNRQTLEQDLHSNKSESEMESTIIKKICKKTRIQLNSDDSDSDDKELMKSSKNQGKQLVRTKHKRSKLKDKFKSLLSAREKQTNLENDRTKLSDEGNQGSDQSDGDISSIKTIKQKIKQSMSTIPSICDPDTSDEESNLCTKLISKQRQKKERKSTNPTSPKPIRMSAKQAMENMQKIKSESNRMLREKEVTLPYHRPKALSLKDIMSRRKPAVTSDGKALPIKMNEEQLKHYASMLEQRQKEMMELCKSESEDETEQQVDDPQFEIRNTSETEIVNGADVIPEIKNKIDIEENSHNNMDTDNKEAELTTTEPVNFLQNGQDHIILAKLETHSSEVQDKTEVNNDNHNVSAPESFESDMKLVYNDSVQESTENIERERSTNSIEKLQIVLESNETEIIQHNVSRPQNSMTVNENFKNNCSEPESQSINLHYDSEKTEINTGEVTDAVQTQIDSFGDSAHEDLVNMDKSDVNNEDFMSDDDFNVDDIDRIIENADIIQDNGNSTMLTNEPTINNKPKLTGVPGMVIDLDNCDNVTKKLTGVELLKEKFTYFATLKTPEEHERQREKTVKPGALHLKLKRDLEDKIAEQRSLEWSKRLDEMKQLELNNISKDTPDDEDDIEKIESNIEETVETDTSASEEELVENDVEIKDKPRKHNPMLDEEAEESECDDVQENTNEQNVDGISQNHEDKDDDEGDDDVNEGSDESSDEESSESEEERKKPKKGRILKAFEDSDDENTAHNAILESSNNSEIAAANIDHQNDSKLQNKHEKVTQNYGLNNIDIFASQANSQDDEIQLAQRLKSVSDDLFSSQENGCIANKTGENKINEVELGTQTFSILDSEACDVEFKSPKVLDVFGGTQPYHDPKVAALVSDLSQNVLSSQLTATQTSQPIGEDILALCTGQFYNNQFVSQPDDTSIDSISQRFLGKDDSEDNIDEHIIGSNDINDVNNSLNNEDNADHCTNTKYNLNTENKQLPKNSEPEDGNLLKSILNELNDPEFDTPKPKKFFTGSSHKNEKDQIVENTQTKKKFTIDSDEENDVTEQPKRKKLKKKKLEKRALHISDDEEDELSGNQTDEELYPSDVEDDTERVVDYDSEENEIEVQPQIVKKKRNATDYFEQEAELTSEDEWVGSGDEDEAGLDRMEREAGDDDVFHQGQLRKELGQIHMREVLDQDKREVRLIQELLFEDGDLGSGHRQRKFRWRNADGDEETGTMVDEFGDTQEDEFESEEQWRKQRHEREVFLRQMQKEDEDANPNVSVNRTTIIKANLSSKTMSSLLLEVNQTKCDADIPAPAQEKKTAKDIPSPKKSFTIFQQSYHGSLLTRGSGALARLAAIATPLAADDDTPKIGSLAPSSKRNFVFAALTPESQKPKVTIKRKAETSSGTPKLVKKMKTEENKKSSKSSLLDHIKVL